MAKWLSAMGRWRAERRMNREAAAVAREIHPALWESVRRKIASATESELAAYAKVRAVQLSQERIDVRMQANPALSGAYGTLLLIKATGFATSQVLAAVKTGRSAA